MFTLRAVVLLSLACLGGCVSYQPAPLDPAAELSALRGRKLDGLVVQRARPGEGTGALRPGAFDLSDGLSDAEVVAVALTLNPPLRAARLEIGEAQALLIAAGQWPNPELGLSLRGGIVGPSGLGVDADVLFELLRPRERAIKRDVAAAKVDEVRANILSEEVRLVAEVRGQRLTVLAAEQMAAVFKEEAALRQRALDLVKQRRQVGEGTELDVSVSELELAEARHELRKAESDVERERQELNRLMGLPPGYAVRLEDSGQPMRITVYGDLPDEELDRRLLAGRPELVAKEAQYRRAEKELELAVLGQYPRLKVGPSYQKEVEKNQSLGVGMSLELPIFNRNQGEIAEKTAQRDKLRAEYAAALHRLRAQAFAASTALRRARLLVEAQEKEVLPLIKRSQELFEGAYRARELSIIDWVTAQQRAVRARREYLESLVRYGKALVELESVTGLPLSQSASQPTTVPTTQPQAQTRPANRP